MKSFIPRPVFLRVLFLNVFFSLFFEGALHAAVNTITTDNTVATDSSSPDKEKSFFSLPNDRLLPDWMHIELSTEIKTSTNPKAKTDIGKSHLEVLIGKADYDYLTESIFGSENGLSLLDKANNQFVFKFRFSTLPTAIKSDVEAQLHAIIDEELDSKRRELIGNLNAYLTGLRTQLIQDAFNRIDSQIAALLSAGKITQEQAVLLAREYKNTAQQQIDAKLAAVYDSKTQEIAHGITDARKEHRKIINDRLDRLQEITTIQEISFSYLNYISDYNLYIHAKVGLFGVPDNDHHVFRTPVTSALSTVSTSDTNLNLYTSTANGMKIAVQSYLFHNRPAYYSANQIIADAASMSQEKFDQYYESHQIDSAALKFLFRKHSEGTYIMIGSYDGKTAIGAGGDWTLFKYNGTGGKNKDVRFQWDIISGRSEVMEFGANAFIVGKPFSFDEITAFIGLEYKNKFVDPLSSHRLDRTVDQTESIAGIRYTLLDGYSPLTRKLHYVISVTAGVIKTLSINTGDGAVDKEENGRTDGFANFQVDVNY